MTFPIILFLSGFSPLYVPVGITVYDEYDKWRNRRAARLVPQFDQAVGAHAGA